MPIIPGSTEDRALRNVLARAGAAARRSAPPEDPDVLDVRATLRRASRMTPAQRADGYLRSTGRARLTPRQVRRIAHKSGVPADQVRRADQVRHAESKRRAAGAAP